MQDKYCPICFKTFDTYPKKCDCGFSGFDKEDLNLDARLFKIFKFAKQVSLNLIPYEKSLPDIVQGEQYYYVEGFNNELRGLEYIDYVNQARPTCVGDGLLAFHTSTIALIINCDYIDSFVFDDCNVKILVLGKDVKGFLGGSFRQFNNLKYIYVDSDNPYFITRDNVLIDKSNMSIIAYPNDKLDNEYKVDEDIKSIASGVFDFQKHLKKLYVPKSFKIKNDAYKNIEIVKY
ncbi:MAG TPA: hypothetical protein DD621_00370 [Clostridiales bacterium]|nr:hypothetical protein [Clostridiales bacterium]